MRYTPSRCFETFPFPKSAVGLADLGQRFIDYRQELLNRANKGLTALYNRFHTATENAADIQTLRDLHVEMDRAVAAAYDWSNLPLDHGFHDTKQGKRFTISEPARREVLDRLLALNHRRYAEEVAAGLHDKDAKKKAKAPPPPAAPAPGRPPGPAPAPAAAPARAAVATFFDMPLFAAAASAPPPPAPAPPPPPPQERVAEGERMAEEAIVAALRGAYAPMAKADILARAAIDERAWKVAIDRLKAEGRVEQVGERRGAKYKLIGGKT
jgi:hypothetical protein